MIDLKRALTESTIKNIVPREVDKIIVQLVEYDNPLRKNLPRKKGSGAAYYVNRRTAATTSAVFVADTDDLTESTGTYAQAEFVYRTLGVQGKVTRKSQAIGANYVDLLAAEMEAKADEFRDKEEWAYLWGDHSSDSNAFDGLWKSCNSANKIAAGSSATGGDLTLDLMDQMLDAIRGTPKLIVCSKRSRRRLNALLQAQQQFVNTVEIKGGFRVMSYNGIPVLISSQIPDTCTVNASCSDISALTGGTLSAIFAVDTSKVFVAELTPLTVVPLAKTSSQYDAFDIICDETLVVTDDKAISMIVGVR